MRAVTRGGQPRKQVVRPTRAAHLRNHLQALQPEGGQRLPALGVARLAGDGVSPADAMAGATDLLALF
jgi:hypothetical protein